MVATTRVWWLMCLAVVGHAAWGATSAPITVTIAPYIGFTVGPDIEMTVGQAELENEGDDMVQGETTLQIACNTDCWISIPKYVTFAGLTPKASMKVTLGGTTPPIVPVPTTPARQSGSVSTKWYYPISADLVHKVSDWKLTATISHDWTVADPVGTFTGTAEIDVALSH